MITKKLLLAAIAATSLIFPAASQAGRLRIEIGDRPYYSYGDRYWDNDYEMVWVPGHWSNYRHHWIHGYYLRGEHRRHHHWDRHRHDDYRDRHGDDDR